MRHPAARRAQALAGRWRASRGAAGVEWVGAMAVAAVLVGALLAGAPASAERLGDSVGTTICRLAAAVGGGACAPPTAARGATRPAAAGGRDRPTALTARLAVRRGEPGATEVAYADGRRVAAEWCAQTRRLPGRGGTEIELLACELPQGTRACARQHDPRAAAPDRLTCEGATIDPGALNCSPPRGLDRLCTVADARRPGQAGTLRWLDCHEQTEPAENATSGHFACTGASPPRAPESLRGCNEDWTRGGTYHRQVLCVGSDGFVRACRGAADNPVGCSRWLQPGSGPCGAPAADGRAICVLQRGRAPYACPTSREPARSCQGVRVAECTLANRTPHDCVERDPGPPASPRECPAPRRGRGRRLVELDLTRVETQFCAAQAVPRPGEALARSFGFASRPTDRHGEITHSYSAGDPEPVVPRGVRTPTALMFAVDASQAVLAGARCATGVAGIDGRGRAVKVWSGGHVGGSRWVDASSEPGGLIVRARSTLYPNPRAEGKRGEPPMVQVDDFPPVEELARGVGSLAFGSAGLDLFDPSDSDEARLLHAGFAEIYGKVGRGELRTALPGVPTIRGGLSQAFARAAAARPWSASADGERRAVAIYRRLAGLAAGLPSSDPLPGCEAPRDPAATWWADAVHELRVVPSPTFLDWCEATKATGDRRGIDREAVEAAFRLGGVPCEGPTDDEIGSSPPDSPPSCRIVRPTRAPEGDPASLAIAFGFGYACGP